MDLCTLKEELRSREEELKELRQRVELLNVVMGGACEIDGAVRERAHSPATTPTVASHRQRSRGDGEGDGRRREGENEGEFEERV